MMNIKTKVVVVPLLLLSAQVSAQSAGSSISLQYGTVTGAGEVHAEKRHAGGALLGGVAGAAIAGNHRGLGALAGGLIGAGIEGHQTGKKVLQQYTVLMKNDSFVIINTEQHDIVVGDCVVVEQGKYANIRRVSDINCSRDQTPDHHKSAADNCQIAKNELARADTDKAIENAVIKIRTLCED
jgi:outer membrane lipoprotein SlyB